ncbi:MAG TPA: sucrase ferredoxin [Gaiellaceae bacterium]|nr:sucrase ferredoxin [Gaiellaceae bacterium]
MSGARCSELSRAAGEPLAATATTATRWLALEAPGSWPRDVAAGGVLIEQAHSTIAGWLARTPGARLLFLRRPGTPPPRLRAFVVRAEERVAEVRRLELRSHADVAGLDLGRAGEDAGGGLVLVCGHGSRDACCALRGTEVYGALSRHLGEEELWISSHHGGHRFAANVLVLPQGLHFGRVEPDAAPALVAAALAGRIDLARYRGRTCYSPPVQAAERALREEHGLVGVHDLSLIAVEGPLVRFRAEDGRELAATVEELPGPAVPASCGKAPERQRRFQARPVARP